MKKMIKSAVLLTAASVMLSAPALAIDCAVGEIKVKDVDTHQMICRQPTPDEGWKLLLDGNKQYMKNNNGYLESHSNKKQRTELAAGQKPYAIVLTCSDSRVPPEILFNKGLGEIFVIRVAGNVITGNELGSIDYAVEHLKSNLIVVLGHEKCGAVKATYESYPAHVDGAADNNKLINIAKVTDSIYPAVDAVVQGGQKATDQAAQIEDCVVENIKQIGNSLESKSLIIKEAKEGTLVYGDATTIANPLQIKYAKYDLDTGEVVDHTAALEAPPAP